MKKIIILLLFVSFSILGLSCTADSNFQEDSNTINKEDRSETIYAKAVYAERFVLQDPSGKTRGGLALDDEGVVTLNFLDKHGQNKVLIALDDEVTHFILLGPEEEKVNITLTESLIEMGINETDSSIELLAGTPDFDKTTAGAALLLKSKGGQVGIITDNNHGSAMAIIDEIYDKEFIAPHRETYAP